VPDDFDIRLGTQALSFFRSVPATVGVVPVDVEIPVIAPGTTFVRLVVPDGQTVILGDLLRQGQTETEKGIPVLGPLFRNHTNEDQNLMILVTPRIVRP
jgi:type II secretory pathway component HofQ